MDNKQIKDGVGNVFTLRMRDLSSGGDGSVQRSMIFATGYPVDYGAGGMYSHCAKSGVIAGGLAANAPIYAFQWPASLLALIRRIKINAWAAGTAFTGGLATFDLYAARAFTAQYSGGTTANLSGEAGQLRTSMGSSQANIIYANTAALSPGTRTLDPDPLNSITVSVPATTNTLLASSLALFERLQDQHPLFLVQNEGFVIRATMPGTGTWGFGITTEWDEVPIY